MTKHSHKQFTRRAFFILCCQTILWSILGINFHRLQVLTSDKYKLLSDKNRIRVTILQALRGLITDRNGHVMVANAFTYSVIAHTNNNMEFVISEIRNTCKDINIVKFDKNLKSNIILCTELTWEQIAKIESNIKINDFVKIQQSYKRVYIYKEIVGYITGYTGVPSKKELNFNDIKKDFLVGKNGLEMTFDTVLQGKHGIQKVEVNAFNRIVREIGTEQSIRGETLKTSIDINLQQKIVEINENRNGVYIVLNVLDGQILAMYSTPGYDPNLFTNGISTKDWNALLNDVNKPMINRAIASLYPPGSIFKIITLLAILNSGISPEDSVYCTGEHQIGTRTLHCWKKYGHGYINAYNAIENSCNIYFAVQSIKCSIDTIAKIAKKFGVGEKTNIELPFEGNGILPDKNWKLKKYNKPWTFGDTVNASIGQGYILMTPIQIALMAAKVATGLNIQPTLTTSALEFDAIKDVNYLNIVRNGMYNAMRNHHSEKLNIAGKTGTSQVISRRDATGKYRDHSLFVGFAPYNNPKYVVLSILENAGWGAETALPITKEIFKNIFAMYK